MSRVPATRAAFAEFREIQTRWFDNDIYGHMNNALHYQLFDTAVNGYLIETGVLDLAARDVVFLVVETGCTYHAEMAFPDVIHAGFAVERLGTSSVRYRLGLFRNDADTAAAEGHFVHVNVGWESRRPVAISDTARDVLQKLVMP